MYTKISSDFLFVFYAFFVIGSCGPESHNNTSMASLYYFMRKKPYDSA
jgi:hypothetical protein